MWAALLAGPLTFGAVVLGLPARAPMDAGPGAGVAWAALGLTLAAIPLGHLLRGRVWARATVGGAVAPQPWLQGNVILWALCEGAAMLGVVAVMLDRPSPERLAVPAAALLAQALAFPRAGPLGLGAR